MGCFVSTADELCCRLKGRNLFTDFFHFLKLIAEVGMLSKTNKSRESKCNYRVLAQGGVKGKKID